MPDRRPIIPGYYRIMNALGDALLSVGIPITPLDEEYVCKAARVRTGLSDFGDPYFREGLKALLQSATNDTRLHFVGRFTLVMWIITQLSNRLLLTNKRTQKPDIFDSPLIPPIIITGLPRSGTTFLHRMLATDPGHRAIPLWEALRPIRSRRCKLDLRRRHAMFEHRLKRSFLTRTDIDRKHVLSPDEPEECMWMLGLTFVNMTPWLLAPVYGYLEWYQKQDLFNKKYQEYRWILQILQSVTPQRRLILKAPEHMGQLDTLLMHVPNALIIQTHRDPGSALASFCSLFYTVQNALSEDVDSRRVGEANLNLLAHGVERNLQFRKSSKAKIFDVFFEQLVEEPIGTVRTIYNYFGLKWPAGHDERLKRYIRDNPRDKHGIHEYRVENFGLSKLEISPRFSDYCEWFGYSKGGVR